MKKSILIALTTFIVVGGSVLLIQSCSEKESAVPTNKLPEVEVETLDKSKNKRILTQEVYYSKDPITNQVYELKITRNNGAVTYHNEIAIGGNRSIQPAHLFNIGAKFLQTSKGFSLTVPCGKTYYLIPFKSTIGIQAFQSNVRLHVECPGCEEGAGEKPICEPSVKVVDKTVVADCLEKQDCTKCTFKLKAGDKDVTVSGGFLLLESTKVVKRDLTPL